MEANSERGTRNAEQAGRSPYRLFRVPTSAFRVWYVSRSLGPSRPQPVKRDREHDDRADDDFLDVVRPPHLLAAVAQERHDQGADHRARDAPFAALQAAAADHDRRDDVELGADRDG